MKLEIDFEINPWASNLKKPNMANYLNTLLHIGYLASTAVNVTSNNSYTEKILGIQQEKNEACLNNAISKFDDVCFNIKSELNDIKESNKKNANQVELVQNKFVDIIQDFTGKTKTSVSRGDIAENYLEEICENSFPQITVDRSSGKAHEADIQLKSPNNPTIIIESKNYTSVVPSKEIVKLKEDMKRTNIDYAIFFSFNSRITGKKNMEIEEDDGKTILYICDMGFSPNFIVLAIKCIIEIAKIKTSQKSVITKEIVQDKINQIIISLSKLTDVAAQFTKTRTSLINEENIIKNALDNIHMNYITNEAQIQKIISDIERDINFKLADISNIKYEETDNIETLISNIDQKKQAMMRNIFVQIYSNNFKVAKSEMNIHSFDVYNNLGKIVSKINIKTKIKLSIPGIFCEFEINKKNSVCILDSYFKMLEKI